MITISADVEARQQEIQERSELLQEIAALGEYVRQHTEALEAPRQRLHELIKKAASKNVRSADIMDLTGYTRQRVWQLMQQADTGDQGVVGGA